MYRTIIRPVVTCGSETWCLTANDERSLRTWERKVLRKIYGPVYDNGLWRIRTNKELMSLYQEFDTVADIKKARLRWLGHVERMSDDRVIKKLYMSNPEGRRSVGRLKMRWLDDVEEDLRKIRISGWRGKARRRDEWKSVLREVKVLQGPKRHRVQVHKDRYRYKTTSGFENYILSSSHCTSNVARRPSERRDHVPCTGSPSMFANTI
jgi:hypothetical protein